MSKRTIFAVIGALILLIAWWSCHHRSSTSQQQTGDFGGGGRRGSMSSGGPVPVVAGKVEQSEWALAVNCGNRLAASRSTTTVVCSPRNCWSLVASLSGNLSLARPAQAPPKAQ